MNPRLVSGMTLALQGDGVYAHDVAIRWSPLPIEQLLIGQRADGADALIPAALALCHEAHCAAAHHALDAAQAQSLDARADRRDPRQAASTEGDRRARNSATHDTAEHDQSTRDERVRIEAARETLRRWLLDFPAAFGEGWPDGTLTLWPKLTTIFALAGFCDAHVFGLGPAGAAQWLALDQRGQRDWAKRGASVPARWLRALLQDADRPAIGTPANVMQHVRQHAAELIAGVIAGASVAGLPHADLWDDSTALPDLASGLLIARLRRLAQICASEQSAHATLPPATGGERSGDIGIGWARTARGLLVHLARVERNTVTAYRIIPPTHWNFGPSSLLRQAFAGRAWNDAQRRFGRLVLLLDPCVPFETEVVPHA